MRGADCPRRSPSEQTLDRLFHLDRAHTEKNRVIVHRAMRMLAVRLPRRRRPLPLAATSPRPLVLGVHGNDDRPEWQCGVWRGIVGARARTIFSFAKNGDARFSSP
jgi:hypothetical protein